MNVLFITWNGPDVTYVEGLFLPIFEGLAKRYDFNFHIIQFTWGGSEKIRDTKKNCEKRNVKFTAIKVLRKPASLGLFKALLIDSFTVKNYIKQHNIDVVMPRATTSAAIALKSIKGLNNIKLLFDADGLPQDERVDFSNWRPEGLQYRIYRDIEALTLRKSDAVIVRSYAAKDILTARAGAGFNEHLIKVISNGKDKEIFNIKETSVAYLKEELFRNVQGPVLVYAGSMGKQYCLQEMITVFQGVLKSYNDAKFLILTSHINYVAEVLEHYPSLIESIIVKTVTSHDVPLFLKIADFGFALRRPTFSMKGVAPIKLGEYLLSSLPVLATVGIGDTERYLNNSIGAFLLKGLNYEDLIEASMWIVETYSSKLDNAKIEARRVGEEYFELQKSIDLYHEAFELL